VGQLVLCGTTVFDHITGSTQPGYSSVGRRNK